MRIIGVDPGLESTGYAVIDDLGREQAAIEGGVVRTKPSDPLESRLLTIYQDIKAVLAEFLPGAMAIEDLHARYQHGRTAILMGHARGVICMAAAEAGVPVFHYQPARAKNMVTGSGKADKEQVQRAVSARLRLDGTARNEHVADAFAVALCHAMMNSSAARAADGRRVKVGRGAA
jgi:crossover junction endodeoxyribonuclease RuvC